MDKEQTAIMRLQEASKMSMQIYEKPLIVTTSGGKDSSVCVELARRAGIPFEVSHSHTTADAPETVYFVRREFKRLECLGFKCTINYPIYKGERTSMWKLIPQMHIPPTRWRRYCCSILKEQSNDNRFIVTGVRWEESKKRADGRGIYEALAAKKENKIILNNDNGEKRQLFETCNLRAKRVCNPIVDWTDIDVWDFIDSENIPVNPLYSCGNTRVGCVGCPLASAKIRKRHFAVWPKYKRMYLRAFERMLENNDGSNRKMDTQVWETAEDVFHWWMEDGVLPGQMQFDDLEVDDEN